MKYNHKTNEIEGTPEEIAFFLRMNEKDSKQEEQKPRSATTTTFKKRANYKKKRVCRRWLPEERKNLYKDLDYYRLLGFPTGFAKVLAKKYNRTQCAISAEKSRYLERV